jgi:hypothetical protein
MVPTYKTFSGTNLHAPYLSPQVQHNPHLCALFPPESPSLQLYQPSSPFENTEQAPHFSNLLEDMQNQSHFSVEDDVSTLNPPNQSIFSLASAICHQPQLAAFFEFFWIEFPSSFCKLDHSSLLLPKWFMQPL